MAEFTYNPIVWTQIWLGVALGVVVWHFLNSMVFASRHSIRFSNFYMYYYSYSPRFNYPLLLITGSISAISFIQGSIMVFDPFLRAWGVFLFPSSALLIWLFVIELARKNAALDLNEYKDYFHRINHILRLKKEYLFVNRELLTRMQFETNQLKKELSIYDRFLTSSLSTFIYDHSQLEESIQHLSANIHAVEEIGLDIKQSFNVALKELVRTGTIVPLGPIPHINPNEHVSIEKDYKYRFHQAKNSLMPSLYEFIKKQQVGDNQKLNLLINTVINQPSLSKDSAFMESIFQFLKSHEVDRTLVMDNLLANNLITPEIITGVILPKNFLFALNEQIILMLPIESLSALLFDLMKKEFRLVVEAIVHRLPKRLYPLVRHVLWQLTNQDTTNNLITYVKNYVMIHDRPTAYLSETTRYENMNQALQNYYLRAKGDYPPNISLKQPENLPVVKQLYEDIIDKNSKVIDHTLMTFLIYANHTDHTHTMVRFPLALERMYSFIDALQFDFLCALDFTLLWAMIHENESLSKYPDLLAHLNAHQYVLESHEPILNLMDGRRLMHQIITKPKKSVLKEIPSLVKSIFILIEEERTGYDRWIGGAAI